MTAAAAVPFDADLMRRYDRDGPRYTSYPTARQFHDRIAPDTYELAATASRGARDAQPLSAYVHLPFCFSPCFYCACNKIVTHRLDRIDRYVRHLLGEISLRSRYFDGSRVIDQMHFGGGTPTFLPKRMLVEIIDALDREFQLTADENRDYSIEIDPRGANHAILQLLAGLGFNRISLGVQDFDENVQRAVNRVQPEATVARVYDAARSLGFRSVNFDLIYGLPLQTLSSFSATLDRVIEMRPDRLAVYGYSHMPGAFKAQRQIHSGELPDASVRLSLLQAAVEKLTAAGYVHIGMDHFALPGDSLAQARRMGTLHRTFQGYTTHANQDLIGFGVSAIGQIGDLYVQNHKSLQDYQSAIASGLLPLNRGVSMNRDDLIRKDVISRIMCHGVVDIPAVEIEHALIFNEYFKKEWPSLLKLRADGLVELSERHIGLTAVGRLLMRIVAMVFDAYAGEESRSEKLSRVI